MGASSSILGQPSGQPTGQPSGQPTKPSITDSLLSSFKGAISSPTVSNSVKSAVPNSTIYPFDKKYGDVTILEFMTTVWSRLAYMKNTDFLAAYKLIFKDDVDITQWRDTTKKNTTNNITIKTLMERVSNDSSYLNNFIPFLPLAQKINVILGEDALVKKSGLFNNRTAEATNCDVSFNIPQPDSENIIFTSISTSNYSGCYVFADTRMPNVVGVAFRGTYSIKAAGSYMQPKYIVLKSIIDKGNIKVITGIYKIMIEMVHTILNTIEDVKEQLRKKTNSDKEIKLIVTGHSLGGALATLFSYVYMKTTSIKKDKLCCISVGAPRVFNKDAAIDFCNMCTTQKLFEYKRLKTTNDPVTIMPFAAVTEYQHPCSDKSQVKIRQEVFRDCFPQVSNSFSKRCLPKKFAMTSNYDLPLNCTQKNKSWYSSSFNFPLAISYHCMYLGILFAGALDPYLYLKSNTKKQDPVEINRFNNHKDTACKLCCYDGTYLKVVYFNLTYFRKQNGAFLEDVYVTKENYAAIKQKLKGTASGMDINGLVPESNAIESTNPEPLNPVNKSSPNTGTNVEEIELTSLSKAPAVESPTTVDEAAPEVDTTLEAIADLPEAEEALAEATVDEAPITVDEAAQEAPAVDAKLEAIADLPAAEAAAEAAVDEATVDEEEKTGMVGGGVEQFPKPNVTEEFLLKVETVVQIPPVEDPNEVMTEQEIAIIQNTSQTSPENAEKEGKKQDIEEGQTGGTKHKKKKRKKTRKRKIKLYL
uniref:Fungal lipase-type domain-containing protein n=1 Tax=viral metagenome TaxID=1070528 RepID=A0A6C0B7V7_9ZZZZ